MLLFLHIILYYTDIALSCFDENDYIFKKRKRPTLAIYKILLDARVKQEVLTIYKISLLACQKQD